MALSEQQKFKLKYRKYFDIALVISLSLHLIAFAAMPTIKITPYRQEVEEIEVIEIPPEIEIPPPPKEIARPKIPIEALDEDVAEDETIEDTVLDMEDLPEAPPPPPPSAQEFYVFDKQPMVKKRVIPEYPVMARSGEIEGEVWLKVTIDERGRVMYVSVVKTTAPIFNSPAIAAMKQWEFVAAEQSGNPVKATIMIPMRFTLDR